jgi:hypothetical protein
MLPVARTPLPNRSSRRMRDLLSGKEDQNTNLTKAQERARRVLEAAKTGRRGDIPSPSRLNLSAIEKVGRGTSAARIRKRRKLLEEGCDDLEEEELDKSAAEAEIGIASPLPRALIRPIAVNIKKIHGLDGEVTDFKE